MSNCGRCGQTNQCACFFIDSVDVDVMGNGFGGNHSTVAPDLDPLLAGPYKFKSTATPDPYPMGYISKSGTQAVAASTITVIGFDGAAAWPGNMEDFGIHPNALTVAADGIYLVGLGFLTLDSTAAASQIAYIRKNGTSHNIAADQIGTAINGGQKRGQGIMTLVNLVAGDYLEAAVFITSATTIEITGTASFLPYLWARWMGPL